MMKKKFTGFILIFVSLSFFGQVGISTSTPTSTLSVNGSFATSYSENNLINYVISATDQVVTCAATSSAPTWILPVLGTGAANLKGREYTIRNVSGFDLTLKGSGSELIESGGTGSNTVTIPNGYTGFVKSTGGESSTGVTWVFSIIGTPGGVSTVFSLQYAKKTVSPIDSNTPVNSVVTIGNLKVRFNGTNPNNNNGYIEYQPEVNSHFTVLWRKVGSGGSGEFWGTASVTNTEWQRMPWSGDPNDRNFNPNNRDIAYAYIMMHNTKENYRITVNANNTISAGGTGNAVPTAPSAITIFVEKLD
ncbi:hypothetical protein HNP38_002496 [Chryseobacterium defluvii]|uniref:Uncharacterized protein n=1 Tax=Chryseobacterium defluvii TaxID=160396 RepID=A0A840KJZ6_9FLAO|nr:hypothetical protein [Chryseobacterium defluvii]MBB4807192.1 hypothetical protein [Chryseobacterium defluvii]